MSKAGEFEIDVWKGGYPVWCEISYEKKIICKIHHNELSDLKYAVEKAMQEARRELGNQYKEEV